MLVGLTGGIGSGKTTVAKLFESRHKTVVYYADNEAKKLMNTSEIIKEQLIKEFSQDVYKDDTLNKQFLANIVFQNKHKLEVLNGIVHPVVRKHLQDFMHKHKNEPYILYENAILFENGSSKLCDLIIAVNADMTKRIERVMKRDKVSKKNVIDRIKNQWFDDKKILLSNYIIENNTLMNLAIKVDNIHNKLTKKYS